MSLLQGSPGVFPHLVVTGSQPQSWEPGAYHCKDTRVALGGTSPRPKKTSEQVFGKVSGQLISRRLAMLQLFGDTLCILGEKELGE